jgi:hypothetical protein
MKIEQYRIGDILRVRVAPGVSIWDVEVIKFNESDPNDIRLDVRALTVGDERPPFTSAILDRDEQVLEVIKRGDTPYQPKYEVRYKELINALKTIQKHLG